VRQWNDYIAGRPIEILGGISIQKNKRDKIKFSQLEKPLFYAI
jgi:hypothetical protein